MSRDSIIKYERSNLDELISGRTASGESQVKSLPVAELVWDEPRRS
jgi:hypothetical protein